MYLLSSDISNLHKLKLEINILNQINDNKIKRVFF